MAFRKGLIDEVHQLQDSSLENIPDKFETALFGHFHRVDEIDIGTGAVHINVQLCDHDTPTKTAVSISRAALQ